MPCLYQGITFAQEQRQAIIEAMSNGVLVITGGPGTGKTTIINAIIQLSEAEGMEVTLAAPTGRAAKRMEEATVIMPNYSQTFRGNIP